MKYFIFDFEKHQEYIENFLCSASLAHSNKKRTQDWFLWKYQENPQGETIMACASENEQITGCVAYGIQYFHYQGQVIKAAMAFENFVHPDFQRQGIFSKLISLIEIELAKQGVHFLMVYPNSNSLRGYVKKGWQLNDCLEYWIKGNSILSIALNLKDIRKPFESNPVNKELNGLENYHQEVKPILHASIKNDYLEWRFKNHQNAEYHFIQNSTFDVLFRTGKRGTITEAQVLDINLKNAPSFKIHSLTKAIKLEVKYDIISFPISKNHQVKPYLKKAFFIKVPNRANFCYKILNDEIVSNDALQNISISAINYHTY